MKCDLIYFSWEIGNLGTQNSRLEPICELHTGEIKFSDLILCHTFATYLVLVWDHHTRDVQVQGAAGGAKVDCHF